MINTNLSPEQRRKLDSLIKDGSAELEKIKIIREGLNEAIKAVAEELDVKPKHVRNAVKVAHKANYGEFNEDYESVQNLLEQTGRGAE